MKKHEILSPQSRATLFNPPIDPAAIVRHYTLSPDDLTLIRQRRRDANRLGFSVHLAYLKFPGRVLGSEETPATDMVAFLAHQLGVESDAYREYAQRDETRREHIGEIQSYLRVRPFGRGDYRPVAKIATTEAIGADRGDVIVAAMIEAHWTRQVGDTRLLCSAKPSKDREKGVRVGASLAQTSAMVPGWLPCGISCQSALQRCSSQSFRASSAGKRGVGCQSLWRASWTFFST